MEDTLHGVRGPHVLQLVGQPQQRRGPGYAIAPLPGMVGVPVLGRHQKQLAAA